MNTLRKMETLEAACAAYERALDRLIERWHARDWAAMSLPDYLGMTQDEYVAYVRCRSGEVLLNRLACLERMVEREALG